MFLMYLEVGQSTYRPSSEDDKSIMNSNNQGRCSKPVDNLGQAVSTDLLKLVRVLRVKFAKGFDMSRFVSGLY